MQLPHSNVSMSRFATDIMQFLAALALLISDAPMASLAEVVQQVILMDEVCCKYKFCCFKGHIYLSSADLCADIFNDKRVKV